MISSISVNQARSQKSNNLRGEIAEFGPTSWLSIHGATDRSKIMW